MTEKIEAWETSDGKIFRTERNAQEHETKLDFIDWLKANIDSDWDEETIADNILKVWNVSRKD